MTKKSQLRRNSDAALAKKLGGRVPNATKSRENVARAWFQLNIVYNDSRTYLAKLGGHLLGYVAKPEVLMKMNQTNTITEFNAGCKELGVIANELGASLATLHARHVDRKGLCKTLEEVNEARLLFEAYDNFKMEVYSKAQPIITDLNRLFTDAVKAIMDGPTDVEFKEVPTKAPVESANKSFAEVCAALEPRASEMEKQLEEKEEGLASAVLQPN